MVQKLADYPFATVNVNNGNGVNFYKNSASDPLRTVTASGSTPYGLPVGPIRMPFMRNPETGSEASGDRSVILLDTLSNPPVFHDFYRFMWNDGSPSAEGHRTHPATSHGNCGPGQPRIGTSASGLQVIFGSIRGFEISSANPIQHVMHLILPHAPNGDSYDNTVLWPAGYTDNPNNWPLNGPVPYGQLFAVPPGTSSSGRGLSALGLRIFAQLQDYGAYAIDGTQDGVRMRGDQFITSGQRTDLINSIIIIKPLLRPILNNIEGQTTSGGGAPRAPNTGFDLP
jgi:hypothetical protein